MIGKRTNSQYEAGKRTGAWVKIKFHKEQEFVIGGYTEPEGSRKHFDALLVGFYEGKNLKFAGRVGTGFSEKLQARCLMTCRRFELRVALSLISRHRGAAVGTKG